MSDVPGASAAAHGGGEETRRAPSAAAEGDPRAVERVACSALPESAVARLRRMRLPADHVLEEPVWANMGTGRVLETPRAVRENKCTGFWFQKDAGHTRAFHGLLKSLRTAFYPHFSFANVRSKLRQRRVHEAVVGMRADRVLRVNTGVPASEITNAALLSGREGGRRADADIRTAVNLYGGELPMRYCYAQVSTRDLDARLAAIRAMGVVMEADAFSRFNPITQHWMHSMAQRRWRWLQAQGCAYHEPLRVATMFDVLAVDMNTDELMVIENKNSKRDGFKVGALPLGPPFEAHVDSEWNRAQLQAKYTAFLVECTYRVRVRRVLVVRTQIDDAGNCDFDPLEVEPWVHRAFDASLEVLAAVMQRMRHIRSLDVIAPPPEDDEEDDEGDSDDDAYVVQAVRDAGRRGGRRSAHGARAGRGGRGGRGPSLVAEPRVGDFAVRQRQLVPVTTRGPAGVTTVATGIAQRFA